MPLELADVLLSLLIVLVSWVGNRLHVKIDNLEATVQSMAVKNAEDHGEVQARLVELETKVDAIPAPWRPSKTNTKF